MADEVAAASGPARLRIVFANRSIPFDGRTLGREPLGGVESALIEVTEALARRGHDVVVFNHGAESLTHRGVHWRPLEGRLPLSADLYVANRDHELLWRVPFARSRALWLHNPGSKAAGWPYRLKMALLPPKVIVLGTYHRSTCPGWMRPRTVIIPLGLSEPFRTERPPRPPPPPRAIFTSNPARNLDWLLRVWAERIHPRFPEAELHLFSGPQVYRMTRGRGFEHMTRVLAAADQLAGQGVRRHEPIARDALMERVATARVMLYRGHEEETFCLALAEAQALGVPCVVQPIGSTVERVRDGETGFVAIDEESFAEQALRLLRDDALWSAMHADALRLQRGRSWDDVAADFERLATRSSRHADGAVQ
jgi:glycosyltransferase involved in cell wall biosynthesis